MKKAILILCLVLIAVPAFAASLTCSWNAPTSRADGSAMALSEIKSYVFYYDTATPPVANRLVVPISNTWPSQSVMTYTLGGLNINTLYYVDVAVIDQYGQESVPSNIASNTTPKPAIPNPPTNFQAPTVGLK